MKRFERKIIDLLKPQLFAWAAVLIPIFAFAMPKISYWPLVLGGAGGLARHVLLRALPPRSMRALLIWMLLALSWIAISSTYAIDTGAGLVLFVKLAGFGLCGFILVWMALEHGGTMKRAGGLGHLVGSAAIVVAMAVDFATSGALTGLMFGAAARSAGIDFNGTATIYLTLLAWPIFVWLRDAGRAWTAYLPLVIAFVFSLAFAQYAGVLALLAGTTIYGMTMVRPKATAYVVAVLGAGFVLLAPVTGKLSEQTIRLNSAPPAFQVSVYHRTKIWEFSAKRIAERPIFGWGIDASRRIPGGGTRLDINRDLRFKDPNYPQVLDRRFREVMIAMPLHPHNAALQVWLELGLIGAVLFAALCAFIPVTCQRAAWSRRSMAAALATFTAAYVIAMLSFSLWQSRWHAMLWLVAASAIVLLSRPSGKARTD